MTYVLDSCVAIKWVLPEIDSEKALRILDDFHRQTCRLLAPDVFPVEIAHALSRAERRGLIPPPDGSANLSDILACLPALHASLPLLPRAYELSSRTRIGVYDCLYVALAEREGCPLLTADDRLVRSLGRLFPFITPLAAIP